MLTLFLLTTINSRKRTIETKFKASKINDLDLLMTMIHTLTGVTVAVFEVILFYKRNILFVDTGRICFPKCPCQS